MKITSKQYIESLEPSGEAFKKSLQLEDSLEILTEGTVYAKKNATYIAYDEAEEAGLQNTKTLLKVSDNALQILRYGEGDDTNMDMTLEQGILNITRYKIPMVGTMDLEVYTHSLSKDLDDDGFGTIDVDYKIKFDEFYSRRTKLEVEVRPS
ncbi:MAG: DUF1934 domain-containing protein [Clostridiales bacterium]|nr:DUF1934 domain-containing protein [Candidatus Crickella merdequi]